MIIIDLQLFSILREKLPPEARGRAVFELEDGTTIADLLDDLQIKRRVTISINDVQETDKNRVLNDGDQVRIFSSISGG